MVSGGDVVEDFSPRKIRKEEVVEEEEEEAEEDEGVVVDSTPWEGVSS